MTLAPQILTLAGTLLSFAAAFKLTLKLLKK